MRDEKSGGRGFFHPSSLRLHPLSLGRLRDLARLDAGRADLHATRPALRALDSYGLKVGVEAAARAVVRVRDVVAELRPLAADFASFSHCVFENLRALKRRVPPEAVPHCRGGGARVKRKLIANRFTQRQVEAAPGPVAG